MSFEVELYIKSNESVVGQCFHPLLSFLKNLMMLAIMGDLTYPLTEIKIKNIQVQYLME